MKTLLRLFIICLAFTSCKKESRKDIITGKWQLEKYFLNDKDITNECHYKNYLIVYDDYSQLTYEGELQECPGALVVPGKVYYELTDKVLITRNDTLNYHIDLDIHVFTPNEIEVSRKAADNFILRYVFFKVEDW